MHIFITKEADCKNGKLLHNPRPCEEISEVEGDRRQVRNGLDENAEASLRESSLSLPSWTPAARRPKSRAREAARPPAGPPAPGSCPDGPARAYLGTHPAAQPRHLPPRPWEPGSGLPRRLPASEEPRGRRARSLLLAGQTAPGAPGAARPGSAGLGGLAPG